MTNDQVEPTVYAFPVPGGNVSATVCAAFQVDEHRSTARYVPVVRLDGTVVLHGLAYNFRVMYQWEETDRPVYVHGRETDARTRTGYGAWPTATGSRSTAA